MKTVHHVDRSVQFPTHAICGQAVNGFGNNHYYTKITYGHPVTCEECLLLNLQRLAEEQDE